MPNRNHSHVQLRIRIVIFVAALFLMATNWKISKAHKEEWTNCVMFTEWNAIQQFITSTTCWMQLRNPMLIELIQTKGYGMFLKEQKQAKFI